MKISFIATVYNEEKTIESFVGSALKQSKLPDEIIITDGGSSDATVEILTKLQKKYATKNPKIKVLVKKGNRSVGRNEAIKHATGDIIVCTDSGNVLDKDWIKYITEPFRNKVAVDVVAGYYKGLSKTIFQKCLVPYVLVMPDKVDPDNFLPATRSVAFTKAIWKKIGGFPEQFSHNEDYVFANRLRKAGAEIVFAKKAIVYWIPRTNYRDAWYMMYRFAKGDAEARIARTRVIILFIRYILGLVLFALLLITKNIAILTMILVLLLCYMTWAITKHYRYINDVRAIIVLPTLQFTADFAVLLGTCIGILKKP